MNCKVHKTIKFYFKKIFYFLKKKIKIYKKKILLYMNNNKNKYLKILLIIEIQISANKKYKNK